MRRSGKYAYVDGVPCTTGWNFTKASSVSRYSASCVPDGTATTEGNDNWTGSMQGIGYLPPMPIEDDFDFIGVASAKAAEIVNYVGSILIQDAVITIPVNAGTPITWTANFGVQGALVKTATPAFLDDTREPGPSAKHGKISIEATPDSNVWTDVAEVQTITITLRRPAVTSVNGGVTFREAGNMEADLSFQVNNDDAEVALYAANTTKRVRVYVTPTLFYMFDAIQFSGLGPFTVNRNPPAIIGYTVPGMWTGLRAQTPPALGEILLPGGAQLYGE